MTTLHLFHRSLATLDDFDEDACPPADGTDMGIVPVALNSVDSFSSNVFIAALVDHLCSLYVQNSTKKDKLFQIVYKLLVKARIVSADFNASQLKSVWFRCQALFIRFMEVAMKQTDTDLEWSVDNEGVQSALQRLFPSVPDVPSFGRSTEFLTYLPTRLSCEFSHLKVIGKGADGRVYQALKRSDGVTYAIKEIKLNYSSHHDIASSTSREVELLAQLSHPHVVRYYDNWMELKEAGSSVANGDTGTEESEAEVDDDENDDIVEFKDTSQPLALVSRQPLVSQQHPVTPSAAAANHNLRAARNGRTGYPGRLRFLLYIQMELCNRTLKQWLEERNTTVSHLTGDDARANKRLFKQILQGVQYIHSKNLLHRDLKPQNVFLAVDSEGRPCAKIGDFGHSRLAVYCHQSRVTYQQAAGGDATARLTENLSRDVGTTLYSAPEQLNCMEHSTKSDMYSLGLVLYELCQPFSTESERYHRLHDVRHGRLDDDFKQLWPQEAVCISELTHNPARRPSATELLHSSIFFSKDELIRQLRGQVSELQLALRHKDMDLRERDVRIAELENQLRLLSSDLSVRLPLSTMS